MYYIHQKSIVLLTTLFLLTQTTESNAAKKREGVCEEQKIQSKKAKLQQPEAPNLIFGVELTCDQKIITPYKKIWQNLLQHENLNNEAVAKIAHINQINECECFKNRFMRPEFIIKNLYQKKFNCTTHYETKIPVGKFFEEHFIKNVKLRFPHRDTELCYVSGGPGGLLQDLRLIIALEKAGYCNIKIVLIDNDEIYQMCCKFYADNSLITNPKNYLEQFCACVSASSLNSRFVIYDSLEKYLEEYEINESIKPNLLIEIDTLLRFPEKIIQQKTLFCSLHKLTLTIAMKLNGDSANLM